MRFTLRNQHKIKEVLGEEFLRGLLRDINSYFKNNSEIEQYDINFKYKIIKVTRGQRGSVHIFYVYGSKYDVLNLAYKETIKK